MCEFFFFKQKTAYEMRISDWSSDVCSPDLQDDAGRSTILFKLAPGAVVPSHEHTALEMTYMLEGTLVDDEGSASAGDFVWRPAGNRHKIGSSSCRERVLQYV